MDRTSSEYSIFGASPIHFEKVPGNNDIVVWRARWKSGGCEYDSIETLDKTVPYEKR